MSEGPSKDGQAGSLLAFLPDAITRVVESYTSFSHQSMPLDAKEFAAHHSACKAALMHLDALFKIIKTNPFLDDDHNDQMADISALIEQAKKDLAP